ncbi:hemagglutinin repeat-containing protein, partial [Ralstonia pseudosolanacearum]|uniref:hemagglutinin repeat-containing protein n=1 Tax=Ralstonia pseudosolanacearum TaxID=1310165 RepID=UPI003D267515
PAQARTSGINFQAPEGTAVKLSVGLDVSNSLTNDNAQFNADEVTLNTKRDARFLGGEINADIVKGKVGGDLVVESRKDVVGKSVLALDVEASTTQVKSLMSDFFVKPLTSQVKNVIGQLAGDKVKELLNSKLINTNMSPALSFGVEFQDRNTVINAARILGTHGVDLDVKGKTLLTGARISAPEGQVSLGNSQIVQNDVNGHDG